jgi:endonuclease/exonuclease/phosphatase (EEP) superfamily protein YafD
MSLWSSPLYRTIRSGSSTIHCESKSTTLGEIATTNTAGSVSSPPMMLRIYTQNLYNGRAEPASFEAMLRRHDPHVVAVQELSANCADVLADWGEARLLDPRDNVTGMGMAVRGEATLTRLEFPHRNPIQAVLPGSRWESDASIEIINAHLVNPIARPIGHSLRTRKAELAALRGVLSRADGTGPRVLAGDLNSSPLWPLYRRVRSLAIDAAVAAGTARRTWGPLPTSPRMLRIDHVFVQGFIPIRTELVSIAGADHRGLLVDLELIR